MPSAGMGRRTQQRASHMLQDAHQHACTLLHSLLLLGISYGELRTLILPVFKVV